MADDSLTNITEKPTGPLARYINEIMLYDRECEKWDRQSKKILRRYKDDRGDGDGAVRNEERRYNILWSNVQNLRPALYAKNPKPDIQRRFKDADPIGRVTSDILERSVTYFTETDHFAATNSQCVLDCLLPGRGTCWTRYVPHMRKADAEITDDVQEGEDTDAPEIVDFEEVVVDYVHRRDFGHNIARVWDEVWCGWRKVYLTRAELIERFGEDKGKKPALDYVEKNLDGKTIDDGNNKSVIYELWDKKRKVAVWFHKTLADPLDERPDPLGLDQFFPFPKPLYATLTNDSLIPVPDYVEYQDQAAELDTLTQKIASMTRSLKVAGVYDASAQGVDRLLSEGCENTLIPVEQWAVFAEKGGLEGVMDLLPILDIAQALKTAYECRDQVKRDLDEITGMSDIIRGNTDPDETATAQRLKSGYATQRLSDRQREVQRFVRETIRIMVDIIANRFQIETIKQISGVRLMTMQEKQAYQQQMQIAQMPPQPGMPPPQPPQPPPNVTDEQFQQMLTDPSWDEVEQLIHDKPMRSFRIDIETDSTIKADEDAEKASRLEYISTMGDFIAKAVQAPPEMAPFLGQSLQFLSRAFPVGKELEGSLNSMIQQFEKQAKNPQQKPDPEMVKVQGQLQLQQAEMQGKQQFAQQQAHLEAQTDQAKAQSEAQVAMATQAAQARQTEQENQMEAARQQAKDQSDERVALQKIDAEGKLELLKARIQQQTAIVVARITAKATTGETEEGIAYSRDDELEDPLKDTDLHKKVDMLTQAMAHQMNQPPPPAPPVPQPPDLSGLHRMADSVNNLAAAHTATAQSHAASIEVLHKAVSAEKEVVRDPKTGKPTGVRVKQNPKTLGKKLKE